MDKAYTVLMSLELGSIGIKYEGSGTNPFQQSTPTTLLFLTAIFCHAVASTADMSLPTTVIIFHMSGVVGCETLLWILLPEFWSWYLINLFVLVVTSLCFFNCMDNINLVLILRKFGSLNSAIVDSSNLLNSHQAAFNTKCSPS